MAVKGKRSPWNRPKKRYTEYTKIQNQMNTFILLMLIVAVIGIGFSFVLADLSLFTMCTMSCYLLIIALLIKKK